MRRKLEVRFKKSSNCETKKVLSALRWMQANNLIYENVVIDAVIMDG